MKKISINFQPQFQLWKACAKDDSRPAMCYVHFVGGYAYASDAHILVRIPLQELTSFEEDEQHLLDGFAIHADVLKTIVKCDSVEVKRDGGDCILYVRHAEHEISAKLVSQEKITAPKFAELFTDKGNPSAEPVRNIGISTKKLSTLASAMGITNIKMAFTKVNGKVFVSSVDELFHSEGVIMPLMITGTLDGFE